MQQMDKAMETVTQADITSAISPLELQKLTTEELQRLCDSESSDKYNELVTQSNKIKSLEEERELMLASVKSLAEFNLAKQSQYVSDIAGLSRHVRETNKLKISTQSKASRLLELSKKTSLEATVALISNAASQAEEGSEEIALMFLDKLLDFDSFLSQYLDKRKLAHARRIKADKLRQETNKSWKGICAAHT